MAHSSFQLDLSLLGKDLERYVLSLIVTSSKKKQLHKLRLVSKAFKESVKLYGSCPFCKDDCRIQINYHINDWVDGLGGGGGSLSTTFEGELIPSKKSEVSWEYKYCNWGWTHRNVYATIVLDDKSKRILKEQVELLASNPNIPSDCTLWTSSVSGNFEDCWGVSEEYDWDETLLISTVERTINIQYYDERQCTEHERNDKISQVNETLALLWKNFGAKTPTEDYSIIPVHDQLLKLKTIVQECFCRFEIAEEQKKGEDELVPCEDKKGCFGDLEELLVNWNSKEGSEHEGKMKQQEKDASKQCESEDEKSDASSDTEPPKKIHKHN